jgi:putative copper export protein
VGGLVATAIFVYPAVQRTLKEQPALYRLLAQVRRRFFPLSILSLFTLIVTGLFQMTADEFYDGFMTFDNTWSQVMLVKHIVIVAMVGAGMLLQFGVIPALERTSLLVEHGKGDPALLARYHQREVRLTWVNTLLGVGVLALSAWLTAL